MTYLFSVPLRRLVVDILTHKQNQSRTQNLSILTTHHIVTKIFSTRKIDYTKVLYSRIEYNSIKAPIQERHHSKMPKSNALIIAGLLSTAHAFTLPISPQQTNTNPTTLLHALKPSSSSKSSSLTRSSFLVTVPSLLFTTAATLTSNPSQANALVKGNAPPPKKQKSEVKCTNVEECQEQAEKSLAAEKEAAEKAAAEADASILKTATGTRYIDSEVGDVNSPTCRMGDSVEIYYKVLKLGKRSYDGLSGEGTVVFSRGYGLEDDEDLNAKTRKTFACTLGSPQLIAALSDAMPGMHVGTIRRISVTPQMGWEVPSKECDGGPGGKGAGGELKTDYVVVPTATMVSTESCFDKDKSPFPNSYAQQRRMAQRFDQSLIIEVELVKILEK